MKEIPSLRGLSFINSTSTILSILDQSLLDLTSLNSSGLFFSTFKTQDYGSFMDNGDYLEQQKCYKNEINDYYLDEKELSKRSTTADQISTVPISFINNGKKIHQILGRKNEQKMKKKQMMRKFDFKVSKNRILQILK